MAYHFDYLTLLLQGAIDAQTRVVRQIYNVSVQPKYASYKNRDFMKRLRAKGAGTLCDLVEIGVHHDFLLALGTIRNRIHADPLGDMGHSSPATGAVGLLPLGGEDAQVILKRLPGATDPAAMGIFVLDPARILMSPSDAHRSSFAMR